MRTPSLILLFVAATSLAHAANVEIVYALQGSSTNIDPFTVPNPQGGNDFTIAPSAVISSGSMTVRFTSDAAGVIGDGATFITDYEFAGTTNLAFDNGTVLAGNLLVATLAGPLTGTQETYSAGALTGLAAYAESVVGAYDSVGGPTTCSDNFPFGNPACAALSAAFGLSFPLPVVPVDNAALPIGGGSFTGLNSGSSTAANTLGFSLPLGGGASASLPIEFTWVESQRRLLVPEPGSATLLLGGIGLALLRRRR